MADEQLGASLELDISAALNDVDNLGSAIDAVMQLTPEVDTSAIEPAIADAVSAADTAVPLEPTGAETITSDIDGAIAGADTTVAVDADTSAADAAVTEVAAAASAEDATITVDADTSGADAAITDLGSSADSAGESLSAAGAGSRDFGAAVSGAGAAAGIAAGSTSELGGAAGALGGGFGTAAVVATGFAGALGVLAQQGIESQGAFERFHAILGPTAAAMQTINVGSLNEDLGKLAISLGTDDEALMQTAATLFQFARNSGASRDAADVFGEQLIALASRAVSLNPALGSVADVADAMSVRLARGGRFAASFGLDLSAAEITTRALGDTGKTTAADLTIYEKSAAAAQIATEKYGDSIKSSVAEGSQNAIIQQRSLKEELNNVIEAAGKPLVVPLFDLIRAATPVVATFASAVGELGSSALPVLATGLQVVGGALELVAPILPEVVAGFVALKGVELVGTGLTALSTGLLNVAVAAPFGGNAILGIAGATETAGLGVTGFAGALGGLALPIGLTVGVAAALTLGLRALIGETDSFGVKVKDLATVSIPTLSGRISDLNTALAPSGTMFSHTADQAIATKEQFTEFNQVLEKTPQFAQKYIDAASKAGISTTAWQEKLTEHTAKLAAAQTATDNYKQQVVEVATATDSQITSTNAVTTALANYTAGTGSAADVNTALKNSTQLLTDAIDLLFGRFLDSDTATNNFKLSILKLGDQLLATGFTFDDNTQKGLANQNALEGSGKAAATAAEAIRNAGGTIGAQQQPFIDYRTALEGIRTALAAAGQDTSFVDGLIKNTDAAIQAVQGKGPDAAAAGQTMGDQLAVGISQAGPGAFAAGVGLINSAGEGAQSVDLSAIGRFAGLGLVAGLNVSKEAAARAGADIAQAAKDAATRTLSIGSPSRVMRDEVGIPFGQGVAEGILASIPEVEKAAAQMTDVAVGAGTAGVKDASSAFTPAAAAGPSPTTLALSSATIDQLAAAIAQRSGQTPGGRGTGIFIENATFGSQGAASDMDFWARVTTAKV